jgi:hypothetical protein
VSAAPLAQLSARYVERAGNYTVHYNVVPAHVLPEVTRVEHSVPPGAEGVLNVAVLEGDRNVAARIEATAVNLAEQHREIEMRQVVENGLVSYLGIVEAPDSLVLDFRLEIVPFGSDEPIVIEFRERLKPVAAPSPPPLG